MPRSNKPIVNTVGGELSPLMYGRVDLPVFQKALARLENFICIPQGGARYRNGTKHVKYTRLNQVARFIPFQFNDTQAYLIEATHKKFRFFKDNSVITETASTINAMTNANPGVFTTSAAHGLAVGDEVYIDSVGGTTGINGKFYLVNTVPTGTTFSVKSILTGTAVSTVSSGTYTSGGSVARVYEITTIYEEVDINNLSFAQNADTMYIAHKNYPPGKLTRAGHASWTLNNAYTRTSDPFVGPTDAMNAATQANPVQLTATAAHGLSVGDVIAITGVVGMTQLNGNYYLVGTVPSSTTLTLKTLAGVAVDGTAYTAYSSGGTITQSNKFPRAVAFTDTGRLMFGGTVANPETIWASKSPTSAGVVAYDDFTTGSGATDAVIFTLAPVHGRVDAIQWLANTAKAVVVGTFGSIRRVYGATEQEPLSPTSVTAKSANALGCAYSLPISNGDSLFYIQRGDAILRSLGFDIQSDGYTTTDRNLVADHLTVSGLKQMIEAQGTPDIIWVTRNDGRLLGLTYKEKEDISGWHEHYIGGRHTNSNNVTRQFGKVLWAARMPRPSAVDQLWLVVERVINGNTTRSVEYMSDPPVYPIAQDFYSGLDSDDETDESADTIKYLNAMFETQKDAVHLDMAVTFDGSSENLASSITLTPGAGATTADTTGVTFTTSGSFFTSAMVGRQLWKKYDENGDGGGRAEITGYTSATQVTCTILSAFDSVSAIAAGKWYKTSLVLSGCDHLEGETVYPIVNGATHPAVTVTNGSVTLTEEASKAHIGFKYRGVIRTLNIDTGGVSGTAVSKPRVIIKTALRLLNTLGIRIGTSLYRLAALTFRRSDQFGSRPPPPFSGIMDGNYYDGWAQDGKEVVIVQNDPVPCTVLGMDIFVDTTDE